MGKVATIFRVMPESPDVDIEKLEKEIRDKTGAQDVKQEPIGFGLVALRVLVVTEDAEGGTDKIEEELSSIEGVGQVDVEESTLI